MIAPTYLERGEPVRILAQWRTAGNPPAWKSKGRWNGGTTFVGRVYLEPKQNGERLLYSLDFGQRPKRPTVTIDHAISARKTGPRNVLIQRADGSLVVRPFRGLRKVAA